MPDNLAAASSLAVVSNPALPLLLGAVLLPMLPSRVRPFWLPLPPAVGMILLCSLPNGSGSSFAYLGQMLQPFRLDPLARAFGTAFLLAALLGAIYAIWMRDLLQQAAILGCAGATVGGVFAGDLITLFVWWELAGLSSTFLIWAVGGQRAARAGQRYLLVQVLSGVLLLGGIALWTAAGNGVTFGAIGTGSIAGALMLFAFGIKAGFPLLYVWIIDTYPEATLVGTVILSAFTTKLAIYALARGFAGTELLFWLGPITAVLALVFALLQQDLRRVLAYGLVIQLGYMVTAVGAGGEAGVNGATAHAVVHISYKMLLFMALGAVMYRMGTAQANRLGGLLRSMPLTAACFAVGAATMAAMPPLAGFVSKGLLVEAVKEHNTGVYWLLLVVSGLVFIHFCLRVFQLIFLGAEPGELEGCPDSGADGPESAEIGASPTISRVRPESPLSMRVAMIAAAVVCVALGVAPGLLSGILPYPVEVHAYGVAHVVEQLALLLVGAALYAVLLWTRRYPTVARSYRVDADALYLRVLPRVADAGVRGCSAVRDLALGTIRGPGARALNTVLAPVRIQGRIAAPWTSGAMAWWTVLIFGIALLAALFTN